MGESRRRCCKSLSTVQDIDLIYIIYTSPEGWGTYVGTYTTLGCRPVVSSHGYQQTATATAANINDTNSIEPSNGTLGIIW